MPINLATQLFGRMRGATGDDDDDDEDEILVKKEDV